MARLAIALALLASAMAVRIPLNKVDSPRKQMLRDGVWDDFVAHQRRQDVLSEVFQLAAEGSDPLTTRIDFQYLAEVEVGTPPQKFNLVPDTGSAVLWVIGDQCQVALQCCGFQAMGMCFGQKRENCQFNDNRDPCANKNKFDKTSSSTFATTGKPFQIRYGDGSSLTGTYGQDRISFGGVQVQTHVAVAQKLAARFANSPQEGIIGLSFTFNGAAGDKYAPTVTGDMVNAGVLNENVFAVKITEKGGEIQLGEIDHSAYRGEISYVPVSGRGYWEFSVDSISVSGQQAAGRAQAISDTGTSIIAVPQQELQAIAQGLGLTDFDQNQGLYKMGCNQKTAPVDIQINGKTYTIPVEHYKVDLGPVTGGQLGCYAAFSINPPGSGDVKYILGDPFLRAYYNIYDMGNSRIGFAEQA